MLIVLARLGSAAHVGQFVLGLAVSAPVMLFASLQLKTAQASDSSGSYGFTEYLGLRVVTTAVGTVIITCVTYIWYRGTSDAAVVLAVAGMKVVEAFIDQFYGLFQQHERLDFCAESLMIRGPASLLVLALALRTTGTVFWACVGIAMTNAAVLVLHDIPRSWRLRQNGPSRPMFWSTQSAAGPRSRPLRSLAAQTLPLGFVAMLASLNPNIPRYLVAKHLGAAALGVFGGIGYLHVIGNTAVSALCDSALPRLGRLRGQSPTHFRSLLCRIVLIAAFIGAVGIAVAYTGGKQFLTLVYGAAFSAHTQILEYQMIASALVFVATSFLAGLTALRLFGRQLIIWTAVVGVTTALSIGLVRTHGLIGASTAIVGSAAFQVLITCGFLLHALFCQFRHQRA
jgi:O-antigen/teichoic acid export membrane protein